MSMVCWLCVLSRSTHAAQRAGSLHSIAGSAMLELGIALATSQAWAACVPWQARTAGTAAAAVPACGGVTSVSAQQARPRPLTLACWSLLMPVL